MNESFPRIPAEYITPININGLRGRMLRMPAPKNKKREILVVYGHHASLERYYSIAQVANDYGAVTMPDLPGFGGMDSFYKIGEKPDIDTMADYLASIVKLRFKNRRLTIVGISYGFVVATRMIQRYPELARKVDLLLSIAGFMHRDDFVFTKRRLKLYTLGSRIVSTRFIASIFRNIALHPFVIRKVYVRTHNAKHKFDDLDAEGKKALTEYEVMLWRLNDLRTHMYTTYTFLTLNNCLHRVDLPVVHIGTAVDNYFDNAVVEQHMRVVFTDYDYHVAPLKKHMPHLLAGKTEVRKLFPVKVRQLLGKQP